MSASLEDVVSGSVTTAVLIPLLMVLKSMKNDNLGMVDGKIVVSNPDMMETLTATFDKMLDEDSEIVTIYIGEDGKEEVANDLAQNLMAKYETSKSKFIKEINQFTHICLALNNQKISKIAGKRVKK